MRMRGRDGGRSGSSGQQYPHRVKAGRQGQGDEEGSRGRVLSDGGGGDGPSGLGESLTATNRSYQRRDLRMRLAAGRSLGDKAPNPGVGAGMGTRGGGWAGGGGVSD